MHIFNKLVDSYRSKNYKEFRELCISSVRVLNDNEFLQLANLLGTVPDVSEAYDNVLGHWEQSVDDLYYCL